MSFDVATTGDDVDSGAHPLRTLSFRINAWYVVVFVASLGLLAAFAVPVVRSALERERQVVLERRLERHVALLSAGLPAYADGVERTRMLDDNQDSVRIRDDRGRILYQHGDMRSATMLASRVVGDLRVEIGAPPKRWDAVLDELRWGLVGLVGGALVIAIAGGYALTRRGLRPVRDLAATTTEVIRSGDLSARVPERGSRDELDSLASLFNRMLDRNQKLVGGMREALDNVSHDLRTPLTRLRGTAELALRSGDPTAAREALADCIEDTDRLLVMLRTIMDISEAETGLMRLDRTRVSIADVAAEVADLYSHVAEDAEITLVVRTTPDVTVEADRARLRQAMANLVDNAIKYSPRGATVTIEPVALPTSGGVRVSDTGPGIPSTAIPRIWDRLFRADPSRSRRGLGLGLSLVKAIAEAHGGTVAVASEPGRGSTFTLAIPYGSSAMSRGVDGTA